MPVATAKRPKSDAIPPDLPATPPEAPAVKQPSGWRIAHVELPIPDLFAGPCPDVVIPVTMPPAVRHALHGNPVAVLQQALADASAAFQLHPDLVRHRQYADAAAAWKARQREAEAVAADLNTRIDGCPDELTDLSRQLSDARLAAVEAGIRVKRFEGEAATAKAAAGMEWKTIYAAAVAASRAALDRQLAERRQELADLLAEHVPAVVQLQEATFALDETKWSNPPPMPS